MSDDSPVPENLQDLIDTHWSYSWSNLPPEAEREVEKAFEHVSNARDLVVADRAEVSDS